MVYVWPDLGVGGSGSPRTTVTSVRVVLLRYCPEAGALVPGGSLLFEGIVELASLMREKPTPRGAGPNVTRAYCLRL